MMIARHVSPVDGTAPPLDATEIFRLLGHRQGDLIRRYYLRAEARAAGAASHRHATEGLADMLEVVRVEVDEALRRAFRAFVGETIRAVSPLVLDACAAEGLELDALVETLSYDDGPQRWLGGPVRTWGLGRYPASAGTAALPTAGEMSARIRRCGVVVRPPGDPRGALGFRVGAACLEIASTSGEARLTSSNGTVSLTTASSLPETVRIASRGLPADRLVEHPLISGRGYRVVRVIDIRGGGTLITMRAPPVSWSVPWARGART